MEAEQLYSAQDLAKPAASPVLVRLRKIEGQFLAEPQTKEAADQLELLASGLAVLVPARAVAAAIR